MSHPLLHPKILAALAIEELSVDDQLVFLSEYGDEIFSTTLTRFEPLLSEPDQVLLRAYLATDPEPEALIEHLCENYEEFLSVIRLVAAEVITSTHPSVE